MYRSNRCIYNRGQIDMPTIYDLPILILASPEKYNDYMGKALSLIMHHEEVAEISQVLRQVNEFVVKGDGKV